MLVPRKHNLRVSDFVGGASATFSKRSIGVAAYCIEIVIVLAPTTTITLIAVFFATRFL